MTSRTIMSGAQSARGADAKSDSIARRVPSRPTLSRLPCAALQAARSSMLPRSLCNHERGGKLQGWLATSDDTSARYGRRQRKRRLGASDGRAQSKSSVGGPFSRRTTTVRPTPAPGRRPLRASRRVPANHSPFFYPRGDGVARHPEGARESTQTAAFVIGAQDRFARFFAVSVRAWMFAAAPTAVAAQIALPSVGG